MTPIRACLPSNLTDLSWTEMSDVIGENVMAVESDEPLCYTCVPDDLVQSTLFYYNSRRQLATAWMKSYIAGCDSDPESTNQFTTTKFKRDVFELYSDFFSAAGQEDEMVDVKTFYKMWNVQFPHLHLRDKCNIVGKCSICAKIDNGRKSAGVSNEVCAAWKTCKDFHRTLYSGERQMLAERKLHAYQNIGSVMHITIDIMESCDLGFPYAGSQNTYSHVVKSLFCGAIVIGTVVILKSLITLWI